VLAAAEDVLRPRAGHSPTGFTTDISHSRLLAGLSLGCLVGVRMQARQQHTHAMHAPTLHTGMETMVTRTIVICCVARLLLASTPVVELPVPQQSHWLPKLVHWPAQTLLAPPHSVEQHVGHSAVLLAHVPLKV